MKTDTRPTCYWRGDLARYTGRSQFLHGAKFYEIVMIAGHLRGELKLTLRAPR